VKDRDHVYVEFRFEKGNWAVSFLCDFDCDPAKDRVSTWMLDIKPVHRCPYKAAFSMTENGELCCMPCGEMLSVTKLVKRIIQDWQQVKLVMRQPSAFNGVQPPARKDFLFIAASLS